MKKYFISFACDFKRGNSGFFNTFKTSIDKEVSLELLKQWQEEIKLSCKEIDVERITILFFKEIK